MSSSHLLLVMSNHKRLEPVDPEGWDPPPRTHTSSGATFSSSVYFLITCSGSGLGIPSGRERDVSAVPGMQDGRAMLREEGSRQAGRSSGCEEERLAGLRQES